MVALRQFQVQHDGKQIHVKLTEEEASRPSSAIRQHEELELPALQRRGNVQLVDEELRIYHHHARVQWQDKFKNHSAKHMKGESAFRSAAKAQHDPFNKAPTWMVKALASIRDAMAKYNVTLPELFEAFDYDGGGCITRQEMNRVLLAAKSDLSDDELTCIFDHVDRNSNGLITIEELAAAVAKTCGSFPESSGHRNVVDALNRPTLFGRMRGAPIAEDCEDLPSVQDMDDRLMNILGSCPRGPGGRQKGAMAATHSVFHGGSDSRRFERAYRRQARVGRKYPAGSDHKQLDPLLATSTEPSDGQDRWTWDPLHRCKTRVIPDTPRSCHLPLVASNDGRQRCVSRSLNMVGALTATTPRYGVF